MREEPRRMIKGVLEVVLLLAVSCNGFAASNSFTPPPALVGDGECIQAGDTVSIGCVAVDMVGIGSTVWRGSAFNCPAPDTPGSDNRITLTHADYDNPGGTSAVCGPLTVQSDTVTDNCYPSTLMFNATADLDSAVVECSIATVMILGNSTLRIGVPPGPAIVLVMSGRVFSSVGAEFTLSWDPPSNADMVVGGVGYSVDGGACGSPVAVSGTSATFAKPPDNRVCSIQVTATNGRCNFTSAPLVINITFEVPDQPNITSVDVSVSQSEGSSRAVISWAAVSGTSFSVVSGGQELVNGSIINYIVTINGDSNTVVCDDALCSSDAISFSGSEVEISLTANNALCPSPPASESFALFEVTRDTSPVPTNVTLRCGDVQCVLRYGVAEMALNLMGEPGVPLPGLTENTLYNYEATTQLNSNVVTVTVTGSFGTCECALSQLGDTDSEADTLCRELGYVGGVRLNSGIVCFTGTTESSQADFVCVNGATRSVMFTAMCGCQTSGSPGAWEGVLQNAQCPSEGLSVGAIVGIVIGALIGLLLVAAIVALVVWLFCCRPDSGTPKKSKRNKKLTDEEHELREPSPITHDPNALYSVAADIRHEAAPESHDEYAVLDVHTKKKPKPAPKAQESSELEKQVGPEGDVYTVPVPKRGSSKRKQESPPPSEEQLAEMYATPDMTQKGRNKNTAAPLFYADIGVSGPSRPAPVPTVGQVTYSTIAGTEPGPVEVVVEPTYAN